MDATSKALCHTKVEEIRRRISEGELTAQQIHDILISEIENELNRPTKEVNMAYVKICEELLSSLGADDEPLAKIITTKGSLIRSRSLDANSPIISSLHS